LPCKVLQFVSLWPNLKFLVHIQQVVLIGSGNVATHLAHAFVAHGISIAQVYSKRQENAEELAHAVHSKATNNLAAVVPDADLYVISVADDALQNVASLLPQVAGIVVHTSGSKPIEVLERFANYGVLYPLQTFSKAKKTAFERIPICLESSQKQVLESLYLLASSLSNDVRYLNSQQRRMAHLAAVFTNNFTNYMQVIAQEILEKQGLEPSLLHPLLHETFDKLLYMSPWAAQTGPAKRADVNLIKSHLELLNDYPSYKAIYQQISESIVTKTLQSDNLTC
jgi:predicted short-subunit dehydrogenase-like oxidoreductase (DUF2520 family)